MTAVLQMALIDNTAAALHAAGAGDGPIQCRAQLPSRGPLALPCQAIVMEDRRQDLRTRIVIVSCHQVRATCQQSEASQRKWMDQQQKGQRTGANCNHHQDIMMYNFTPEQALHPISSNSAQYGQRISKTSQGATSVSIYFCSWAFY